MRQRGMEWTIGIVFVALAASVLVVATSFIESTALRLVIFVLAAILTIVAAFVLDAWSTSTATEGVPKFRGGFLTRAYTRLRRRDWLAGVIVLWLVAAVAIGLQALVPTVNPIIVLIGLLGIFAATIAFLWGDFTPVPGGREGRPPAT